jgi:hypothetical protein
MATELAVEAALDGLFIHGKPLQDVVNTTSLSKLFAHSCFVDIALIAISRRVADEFPLQPIHLEHYIALARFLRGLADIVDRHCVQPSQFSNVDDLLRSIAEREA